MKKRLLIFLLIIFSMIVPKNVLAIGCSGGGTVEVGETVTISFSDYRAGNQVWWSGDLDYDSGKLEKRSGDSHFDIETPSLNLSYTFYAYSEGTASVGLQGVNAASSSDNSMYIENGSSEYCTINIVSATRPNGGDSSYNNDDDDDDEDEVDPDKSENNYLKSLSIDGVKISPTFNKDKLEYTAVVPGNKEKVNIKGEPEDDKASIEGLGEKELQEGINKIEIKVTAENGTTKTYIISITRKEKNPIEVTINKKKYTVAKKDIGLKVPDGFVKTKVVIEKQEVDAYSNSFTGYLLVALVDEDGNAGWFIYNQKNGTFVKYSEFKSKGLRLVILEAKKKDVPYKYKKCKVEIDKELVDGYALALGSDFRLVYALNMDTGEKSFYQYDMKENTFQRFSNIQVDIYRQLLKKLEIGLIGLGSIIIIMFIIIISQHLVNKKTKRFIKNGGKKEKEEPLQDEEDIEEEREKLKEVVKEKSKKINEEKKLSKTKTMKLDKTKDLKLDKTKTNVVPKIEEEKPLTREEIRRRKKERKRELEEARRDFFDL